MNNSFWLKSVGFLVSFSQPSRHCNSFHFSLKVFNNGRDISVIASDISLTLFLQFLFIYYITSSRIVFILQREILVFMLHLFLQPRFLLFMSFSSFFINRIIVFSVSCLIASAFCHFIVSEYMVTRIVFSLGEWAAILPFSVFCSQPATL